jgi:hypothetical protein
MSFEMRVIPSWVDMNGARMCCSSSVLVNTFPSVQQVATRDGNALTLNETSSRGGSLEVTGSWSFEVTGSPGGPGPAARGADGA